MQSTWIVVADCDCAAIYTVPRGMARLRQCGELKHHRTATGTGSSDVLISDPALGTHEQQARSFAAQVALHVEDARLNRRFDELILVAPPTFLACLRECLSQTARDAIVAEIAKNLVGARQDALQEQILRVL